MLRTKFSNREAQAQFLSRFKTYGNSLSAILGVFSLSGLLLVFGCSGARYGSLKHSRDVTQSFETYHVYPEHRYYHLNLENNPYAVVALQNNYRILDKQWTEFDPQTEKLEKVVDLVKSFPVNCTYETE